MYLTATRSLNSYKSTRAYQVVLAFSAVAPETALAELRVPTAFLAPFSFYHPSCRSSFFSSSSTSERAFQVYFGKMEVMHQRPAGNDPAEDDSISAIQSDQWDEPDQPDQSTPRGFICESYTLYRTNPDENGYTGWSEEPPVSSPKTGKVSKSDKYALIIKKTKCYDGKRDFKLHSIEVQSEPLKQFLAEVLDGYAGITCTLRTLKFKAPFEAFVHRWEELCKARNGNLDDKTRLHVELLYGILDEELREPLSRMNDLLSNRVISFDMIWTLFQPGATVFSVVDGRPRAFARLEAQKDPFSKTFSIQADCVDYDGQSFRYSVKSFEIYEFDGTLPITSLDVFPIIYHPDRSTICRDLVARGKTWQGFKGYHYKSYEGPTAEDSSWDSKGTSINSRIIIDAESYSRFSRNIPGVHGGSIEELSDEDLMIATPILRGYVLKNKMWASFFLDTVKDIVWSERAFDSLVLPTDKQELKSLILAFARSHAKGGNVFDDVIQGKGRGIVMLLSGPPGVGKTLTAESVAEEMKVPLFVLDAGDIGSSPQGAERCLKQTLSMVPKWNAVLLLDEADVFMAARNVNDLQRNELVSIFLRELEYYEVCTYTHYLREPTKRFF